MTRLEEQWDAFQRELTGTVKRDTEMHTRILVLIEKQDERMDREHDALVKLAGDLRSLVADVASDVRNIATKLAIAGTVLVVAANILGPLIVKNVNLPIP